MRRIFHSITVLTILGALAAGSASLSPARAAEDAAKPAPDAAAMEKIIRDYLLKHPEVIVEALEEYKARAQEREMAAVRQTIEARRKEIYNDPDTAVGGNADGDITIVEFFDYRCGVCKRTHPVVEELLKRDGKVRFVYKEWPILGPQSVYASRAAIASRKQNAGKYVAFHNAMMKSRQITRDTVMAIAASVGLDTKQLERDMKSPDVEAIIKRNYELAQSLKLNGTPSFLVGGTVLRGARDLDTLQQIVKDERGKS